MKKPATKLDPAIAEDVKRRSIAAATADMVRWLDRHNVGKGCTHCGPMVTGKPLPCRHCGAITSDMFDVGGLDRAHDHHELCATCWRAGVGREQSAHETWLNERMTCRGCGDAVRDGWDEGWANIVHAVDSSLCASCYEGKNAPPPAAPPVQVVGRPA
jgi:hypothetical protein